MDGTLIHHQINDLIRNYDASGETIVEHLTVLLRAIQGLNPIVFYLSSRDVAQRLTHAHESRKQSIPTREKLAFWENRKHMDLYVLGKIPVTSHILNVDGGWDTVLEMMIERVKY